MCADGEGYEVCYCLAVKVRGCMCPWVCGGVILYASVFNVFNLI